MIYDIRKANLKQTGCNEKPKGELICIEMKSFGVLIF